MDTSKGLDYSSPQSITPERNVKNHGLHLQLSRWKTDFQLLENTQATAIIEARQQEEGGFSLRIVANT